MSPKDAESASVPEQVERGGLVWNLVDRVDGTWGIQQGLSHQGVLERAGTAEVPAWRVVTSAIAYTAPDDGFGTWADAVDDFLSTAGSEAIDVDG